MKVRSYASAEAFLQQVGPFLEAKEAANSLILGICGQLVRDPGRYQTAPCLKSVDDEEGKVVLAALMTPPHRLVLSTHRGDPIPAARQLVGDLLGTRWMIPGVMAPEPVAHPVVEAWTERTGQHSRLLGRQRLYELREMPQTSQVPGRLRQAQCQDVGLVARWREAFHGEALGHVDAERSSRVVRQRVFDGDIYLWEDGQPVSMAMRTRPTRYGASISLVYTPPEQRDKGYATACVGALSLMLIESGRAYCALFADVANPAANRVYRRLGYRPLSEFHEIEFVAEMGVQ